MEKLIAEVETYAKARGWKPQRVLREAIAAGGGQWAAWKTGSASPTMRVADRLRAWMQEHPAKDAA